MQKKMITAVLGPTNTGKTFQAIETMLSFDSGMIGFPLRLLAREVYDKVVKSVGQNKVALITGEEKIIPSGATGETEPKRLGILSQHACACPSESDPRTKRNIQIKLSTLNLILKTLSRRSAICDSLFSIKAKLRNKRSAIAQRQLQPLKASLTPSIMQQKNQCALPPQIKPPPNLRV